MLYYYNASESGCLSVPCKCRNMLRYAPTTETATAVHIMCERQNTLVCCFDPTSPRISAFDIHEWIHAQLQVTEQSVITIQIDGTRPQVFIKFTDVSYVQDILHKTNGTTVYKLVSVKYPLFILKLQGWGRAVYD